jgi:hypothetical protein
MSNFMKNEDCPPSQDLLAFQLGDLDLNAGRFILKHIAVCEFCAAESDFYSRYPQFEDGPDPDDHPAMPQPLFELAQSLLNDKGGRSSLDRLLYRNNDDQTHDGDR